MEHSGFLRSVSALRAKVRVTRERSSAPSRLCQCVSMILHSGARSPCQLVQTKPYDLADLTIESAARSTFLALRGTSDPDERLPLALGSLRTIQATPPRARQPCAASNRPVMDEALILNKYPDPSRPRCDVETRGLVLLQTPAATRQRCVCVLPVPGFKVLRF